MEDIKQLGYVGKICEQTQQNDLKKKFLLDWSKTNTSTSSLESGNKNFMNGGESEDFGAVPLRDRFEESSERCAVELDWIDDFFNMFGGFLLSFNWSFEESALIEMSEMVTKS